MDVRATKHTVIETEELPPAFGSNLDPELRHVQSTPDGNQPAPGAWVAFVPDIDLYVGGTRSDADGHYTLCNLPLSVSQAVVEASTTENLIDVPVNLASGVNHLDIVVPAKGSSDRTAAR